MAAAETVSVAAGCGLWLCLWRRAVWLWLLWLGAVTVGVAVAVAAE